MSDLLNDQPHFQDDRAAQVDATTGAHGEQQPDAAGVGRAQRSEPERSEGERSGARPTPADSPSVAPDVGMPGEEGGDLPQEEWSRTDDAGPRLRLTGRSKGRRLVKQDLSPAPALTAEQRLLLLDTWQRSGLSDRIG